MISYINNIFKLDTKNTSYVIRISFFNHVLSDYYGAKIIEMNHLNFLKKSMVLLMEQQLIIKKKTLIIL